MIQVTVHEAKTHLSRLLKQLEDGEEIIIAKGKKPVAKLVLLKKTAPERTFGLSKGQIEIADDFDAELEDFKEYMP